MPGWTDLKPEMASSWKVSWNVDPLPMSVPLRAAPAEGAAPPPSEESPPGASGEHPARARAVAAMAAAAIAACCRRRSGISGTPYGVHVLPGRDKQCRTVGLLIIPGDRYALTAQAVPSASTP